MQMISKDAVLKIVQQKGPVIPNDIRKEMGGENILISAILSELSQNGKVKITHTKIGGSPAYYAPGTEERLQGLMKYLNQKDKETAELLMQKKVLKDTDLTPLLRVSLRNIRDFAKPLEVNVRGVKEIYWKWYMLPTPDAEKLIMGSVKPSKKPEVLTPKKPLQPIAIKEEPKIIAKPETKAEAKKEEPKKAEIKKEELKKIEVKKEDMQTSLGLGVEELEKEKDPFFKKVLAYFKENEIQVLEYKVLRKNSEIDLMITVPSRIGSHEYYCKAKNKKKVNDGELSSIYVQSQAKRLPVIFITTGELTKKAKEMLAKDFKGMIVKRI